MELASVAQRGVRVSLRVLLRRVPKPRGRFDDRNPDARTGNREIVAGGAGDIGPPICRPPCIGRIPISRPSRDKTWRTGQVCGQFTGSPPRHVFPLTLAPDRLDTSTGGAARDSPPPERAAGCSPAARRGPARETPRRPLVARGRARASGNATIGRPGFLVEPMLAGGRSRFTTREAGGPCAPKWGLSSCSTARARRFYACVSGR